MVAADYKHEHTTGKRTFKRLLPVSYTQIKGVNILNVLGKQNGTEIDLYVKIVFFYFL